MRIIGRTLLCIGPEAFVRPVTRSVEEQEVARRREEGNDGAEVEPDWGRYTSEASAIIVHHDSILRNKRLLFTYM
jgi:hypothetical protein